MKQNPKKSRFFKIFGGLSLATLITCGTILSFTPIFSTPTTANTNTNPTTATSPLGLNPKTDPVVYTTESGLQIKKSNGTFPQTVTTTTNTGYQYTQDLTSFYYFTMGTFSGTIYTAKTLTETYEVSNEPVNWLIIGRGNFDLWDETPAGVSIKDDAEKQELALMENLYLPLSMQSITQNDDIPDNCFLVLSEKLLGQMYFNSSADINSSLDRFSLSYIVCGNGLNGNRYRFIGAATSSDYASQTWVTDNNPGGSLYNYINNLFSKNNVTGAIEGENKLGFTQSQAKLIVPQQLYTCYYSGSSYLQESPNTDGNTYYTMFPLAYRAASTTIYQNFCLDDYLQDATYRVSSLIGSSNNQSYLYYTRSGSSTHTNFVFPILPSGEFGASNQGRCLDSYGVRPAFVLKLV